MADTKINFEMKIYQGSSVVKVGPEDEPDRASGHGSIRPDHSN